VQTIPFLQAMPIAKAIPISRSLAARPFRLLSASTAGGESFGAPLLPDREGCGYRGVFPTAFDSDRPMLIDSHHHLWKYSAEEYGWIDDEMSVLRRDFLAPELQQVAEESSVAGFVTVQARQSIEETHDLLQIADAEPLIRGVVGWVDLANANITAVLDSLSDAPLLKGVRHVVQDEPDDRFILGADFNRGIAELSGRGLVYDVLIFARQLPASIEFVDHHPDLPMVLDHIAKPTIRSAAFDDEWGKNFRELAQRENISCKFSGVVTEVRDPEWSIDTIRPYWDVALEAFTPQRLMFGSDWPVCLLKTGHSQWVETVRQLASELSEQEQSDFYANNAIRAYNLNNGAA
jgi:L-fuconolactonase